MKALNTILKIVAALAAVAGAIYVVATYGDKIVAWAKKLWSSLPQCPEVTVTVEADTQEEPQPAEEAAVQEEPAEEVTEEAPVVEVSENEPVADEADFAE